MAPAVFACDAQPPAPAAGAVDHPTPAAGVVHEAAIDHDAAQSAGGHAGEGPLACACVILMISVRKPL
jgi:hypothetical protein